MDSEAIPFVVVWLVTVGISIYIITSVPKVPGVSKQVENMRGAAIVVGFFPCFLITLAIQLIYLGLYKWRSGKVAATNASLSGSLPTNFGSPSGPTSTKKPGQSSGTSGQDNPFG